MPLNIVLMRCLAIPLEHNYQQSVLYATPSSPYQHRPSDLKAALFQAGLDALQSNSGALKKSQGGRLANVRTEGLCPERRHHSNFAK